MSPQRPSGTPWSSCAQSWPGSGLLLLGPPSFPLLYRPLVDVNGGLKHRLSAARETHDSYGAWLLVSQPCPDRLEKWHRWARHAANPNRHSLDVEMNEKLSVTCI